MKFDLENPLAVSLEEHQQYSAGVSALFAAESDHMPSFPAFKSTDSFRCHSLSLISQAQSCYNFDRHIAYLAVNYMDRFLSKQVVLENKPWIVRILVIACLSLASKMTSAHVSLSHIQIGVGSSFDAQSVHRMETLLLTTLKWRLHSITPFSFLQFFVSFFESADSPLTPSLKQRASDIIFNTHHEIKLFECKPSIVAASALLCAADELIPQQCSPFFAAISECHYLNEEELKKGLTLMRESLLEGGEPRVVHAEYSSTLTPKSVLESEGTTGCQRENPTKVDGNNIKRRRLNEFRDDQTFQISQVQRC